MEYVQSYTLKECFSVHICLENAQKCMESTQKKMHGICMEFLENDLKNYILYIFHTFSVLNIHMNSWKMYGKCKEKCTECIFRHFQDRYVWKSTLFMYNSMEMYGKTIHFLKIFF